MNHTLKYFGIAPRPVEEFNFYAGDGIDMALKLSLIHILLRSVKVLRGATWDSIFFKEESLLFFF